MASSKKLGVTLQRLRISSGLTQDELADKAGISYSTLTKIERGAIANPSIFTIAAIAEVLDISLDVLADNRETRPVANELKTKFIYSDINGVMVKFYQRAFVKLANELDMPLDKIATLYMHYDDACDRGEISLKTFNELMGKRLGIKLDWKKRYFEAVEPVEQMHKFLEELSKQYSVGLISNIRETFIDTMLEKGLLPKLKYSTIMDSSVIGAIKPENKMFEEAEQASCVEASEIMLIDDTRANVIAAQARGWKAVQFDTYDPEGSIKRVQKALND